MSSSHDNRNIDMFIRVRDFGAHLVNQLPPTTVGGQALAELNAVIPGLREQASRQVASSGSARLGSVSKAGARAALKATMHAMHVTVRAIAIDTPGLETKFRLTHARGDQALLNAARAFVEDSEPLKAKFIEHDMPANFIEELKREIDEFQAAVTEQNDSLEARHRATVTIDGLMERAFNAVHRLDAVIPNRFRDDPVTLSAWQQARHVERHKPRSTDKPDDDPPTDQPKDDPPTHS